jgi:REP element-mobilizing transposase RayT
MTAPRQVLPGTTWLVTRRCTRREFRLRPSESTNQIFLYLLAVAARRYHIRLHAFCVLSNHYHLVVTDPQARLPAFHQYLDSLVGRATNASTGRWEDFFTRNSYSAVALSTPQDVLDKAAYVLANPVAAGLVRRAREWPGLWSAPEQIGAGALEAPRPKTFFNPKGSMPEVAELELTVPDGFASAEEFRDRLAAAVAQREDEAARGVDGFLGVARVLAQKPNARPASLEPRRGLNPRVAARDKWKRIEALGRLVEFLRAYRTALAARRRGALDALFPAGTYLMRVAHGAPCVELG